MNNYLMEDLTAQCLKLYETPDSAAEKMALARLLALANASPAILLMLAEPWSSSLDIKAGVEREKLICCARLHLYSRVLDDAVDEGASWQKLALLRIQPLFFETVGRLASISPQLTAAATKIISSTIDAVIANDKKLSPDLWGQKNGHLLLIPLYLSENEEKFWSCRRHLLQALGLLQAWDEYQQGSLSEIKEYCRIITTAMSEVNWLLENGWQLLAEKLCLEGKRLIGAMDNLECGQGNERNYSL